MKSIMKIRKNINKNIYTAIAISSFIILLLVWLIATESGLIENTFLPSPIEVLTRLIKDFSSGDIWPDMGISIYRIMSGFILAIVLGIPVGILIGSYKIFEAFFQPIMEFIRYMPVPAFVPLVMMWVGIGESAKTIVIFLGVFFQLILMVADDVRLVPDDLLKASYTLGATQKQVLLRVIVPAVMPRLMDTLRILLGWAWTYVTVAELVAASSGLGYRILKAQRFILTDSVLSGILVIGLLGLISDRIFGFVNKKLFPWRDK